LEEWKELKRFAEQDLKIDFFSSPFSLEAIDMLEDVGMETYKIASGEVSNTPLLEKVAKTGKRVLLSSGMSSWQELDVAVEVLQSNGCSDLVVLQCTSEYPCPPEHSGLNILDDIKNRYKNVKIGYSDHTMGVAIALGAVIKGATVIEKHFTLSQNMYGSDAMNSIEPKEFKRFVDEIRQIELALTNNVDKDDKAKSLKDMKNTFEKSIVSVYSMKKLDIIDMTCLAFKKPGDGISAKYYKDMLGKKLNKSINKNYKFKWEDFE
jgi:sialic acid synthase SpsE